MQVIRVRNVHQALPAGLDLIQSVGQPLPSRAGNCLVVPGPVTTVYDNPCERVLFWPDRDANPFFGFFECLHFIVGRDDVAYLKNFIKDYDKFSDDGIHLTAAYGYRWRRHWHIGTMQGAQPIDQLERVVTLMRNHPNTRRAVITMWDPVEDLREDESGKDLPCNQQILLGTSLGKRDEPNRLNIMVTCRSNDIIFGCYGTNAIHFSFLHEYLAAKLGLAVGSYTQVSWNYHAYEQVYAKIAKGDLSHGRRSEIAPASDPYSLGEVEPYPLVQNHKTWDQDLALFMEDPNAYGYDNKFFSVVAKPLWFAHVAYKKKKYDEALEIVEQCRASDWRRAAQEWIQRRMPK